MAELRMLPSPPPKVRCRQILEGDLDAVAELLCEGFPDRSRKYWTSGLARMGGRPGPAEAPRYGYVLEADGVLVGVLLLLFTGLAGDRPRFNVSSWYVRPAFRGFASLMATLAVRRKDAVYLNTSPIAHSLPLLHAMGFRPLNRGQFLAAPLLSRTPRGARARAVGPQDAPHPGLDPAEFELARAHAALGCLSLVCEAHGRATPFVFVRRDIRYSPLGVVQLVWKGEGADYAACAGALGRALAARGALLAISDANGPVPGLVGGYFPGKSPKFFKGPAEPRVNDLAFTEAVIFGP
ncbi:MAG: hypothetical protein P4L73_08500 [Caulobacteraceae bacterium]|nr:hypothetical protein [Caulobacteraceae bacterium]